MNTLRDFINSSALTKLLANVFLFIIVVGSAFVVGYQLLHALEPNSELLILLGVAIGSSIKILGISTGVSFMQIKKEEE